MKASKPTVILCVLFSIVAKQSIPARAQKASNPLQSQYQVGSKSLNLIEIPEQRALISAFCQKSKPCQAVVALKKAALKTPPHTQGGTPPGHELCKQQRGAVIIAHDSRENELAFCSFQDGSLVNTDALSFASLLKKRSSKGDTQ